MKLRPKSTNFVDRGLAVKPFELPMPQPVADSHPPDVGKVYTQTGSNKGQANIKILCRYKYCGFYDVNPVFQSAGPFLLVPFYWSLPTYFEALHFLNGTKLLRFCPGSRSDDRRLTGARSPSLYPDVRRGFSYPHSWSETPFLVVEICPHLSIIAFRGGASSRRSLSPPEHTGPEWSPPTPFLARKLGRFPTGRNTVVGRDRVMASPKLNSRCGRY